MFKLSARRQNGLTGYCFKYKDRLLCLQTNEIRVCYSGIQQNMRNEKEMLECTTKLFQTSQRSLYHVQQAFTDSITLEQLEELTDEPTTCPHSDSGMPLYHQYNRTAQDNEILILQKHMQVNKYPTNQIDTRFEV